MGFAFFLAGFSLQSDEHPCLLVDDAKVSGDHVGEDDVVLADIFAFVPFLASFGSGGELGDDVVDVDGVFEPVVVVAGFALFGLADSFLLDRRLWDDVVEVMPRCVRVIGFRVRHEDDFLSESLTITF